MSTNEQWKSATKEQIKARNKTIVESIRSGSKKSELARRFNLSSTRITMIYKNHLKEERRRNSTDFIDMFACVRNRHCLARLGINSFDELIDYATVDGKWSVSKFLGKGHSVGKGHSLYLSMSKSIIPNFGKRSYEKMLAVLEDNCSAAQKRKLKSVGFYEKAPIPNTEMKERAEYERLKKKYE